MGRETTPTPMSASPARLRLANTFTALRYPNYRLWFWGQMISLFGTWMQTTAQGFLIYQLTRSPAYLGYASFASGVAIWLFMLFGGVVADRVSRRRLLLYTQTYMMLLAFVLAVLTGLKIVQPWHILVLSFLLGVGNAFDAPARQAFVLEMVAREDLTNAVALNSTMFNTAMAVGPAAGGLLYAWLGPTLCFTVNGLTFLAVIVALLLMRIESRPHQGHVPALQALAQGVRYSLGHTSIRGLIGLAAALTLFALSFVTLFPAWAVAVLGGNAATNGWLQSARGLGALTSALLIASLGRFNFRGRLLTAGSLLFPAILLAFAFVRSVPLALVCAAAAGFASLATMNMTNSLLQTLTSDEMRGRVMSLYSLTIFGLMPIGSLLAGTVAEHLGEPVAVGAGALIALGLAASITLLTPRLRRLE
jgi:MFS family permease